MSEERKDIFDGARKVTCGEASTLLHNDQAYRAWFRPDGILSHKEPENDPAFVWAQE